MSLTTGQRVPLCPITVLGLRRGPADHYLSLHEILVRVILSPMVQISLGEGENEQLASYFERVSCSLIWSKKQSTIQL
jgi:hypothetical protein